VTNRHPSNVLFIGHLWPEPTSSAAGYRTLALLKSISSDQTDTGAPCWQVHFACAAEKTEFCANLEPLNISSHQIKLNDSSFDHFVAQLKPEIVFYDRFITEEQFAPRVYENCPQAINILDTQDLHFLRRARQKALKNKKQIELHSEDAIREIAAITRCDLSLIISSYEMLLLTEHFKVAPELLHYCPFMITLDEKNNSSQHRLKSYQQRENFVMIGNFLHPPNWDAVLWCYQSIWPLIKQQLPQAQMHVYGAYVSDKVWQLHQPDKGFFIKGRASDAVETLEKYRVNFVPLRFGAGIKGKIADGFLARTPCVSTPIGQEGMAGNLPWGGLISDTICDEKQIAQDAVELYSNATLWEQSSQHAYQIIQQQFNESQHSSALLNKIHTLCNNLSEFRNRNFYGQILRHQLYRSQYFMSKWIEEKNSKAST
jgi:O-antigen biosynthesis protein